MPESTEKSSGFHRSIRFHAGHLRLPANLLDGLCQALLQFGSNRIVPGKPWQSFALRGWTVTQAAGWQDRQEVRGSDVCCSPVSSPGQRHGKAFRRRTFLQLLDGRLPAVARNIPCFGSTLINACISVTA
jgi:hypothetical protein